MVADERVSKVWAINGSAGFILAGNKSNIMERVRTVYDLIDDFIASVNYIINSTNYQASYLYPARGSGLFLFLFCCSFFVSSCSGSACFSLCYNYYYRIIYQHVHLSVFSVHWTLLNMYSTVKSL
jgi:hypothetical protein